MGSSAEKIRPLVQLPLSEGAKRAAALRSTPSASAEGSHSMKEVTLPTPEAASAAAVVVEEWSPSCEDSLPPSIYHLELTDLGQ